MAFAPFCSTASPNIHCFDGVLAAFFACTAHRRLLTPHSHTNPRPTLAPHLPQLTPPPRTRRTRHLIRRLTPRTVDIRSYRLGYHRRRTVDRYHDGRCCKWRWDESGSDDVGWTAEDVGASCFGKGAADQACFALEYTHEDPSGLPCPFIVSPLQPSSELEKAEWIVIDNLCALVH